MKPRIYHNPRCSKSRAALALLEARGLEPEIVEYLDTPPDAARLRSLLGKLSKLGVAAKDLVRSSEDEFRDAGIDLATASDDAIVAALVERPRLLQRPIVEFGDAARIGRPPERILELFE
jgi:arsenate reductase